MSFRSIVQVHQFHVLFRAQDPHRPIDPRAGTDHDEPAVVIILGRIPHHGGIPGPTRHAIILGRRVHGPLIRRAFSRFGRFDPAPLAAGCDQSGGLPSGQARHVAQLGDRPAPLGRIPILHAGVKEAHAGIHHGSAQTGVDGHAAWDRLDAGADAADGVRPARGTRSSHPGRDHGGRRHGRLRPHRDDPRGIEEHPDAGNGVRTIVQRRAERRR